MTFVIEYSKNARFKAKSLDNLDKEIDINRFKWLLATKSKELRTDTKTYKIK